MIACGIASKGGGRHTDFADPDVSATRRNGPPRVPLLCCGRQWLHSVSLGLCCPLDVDQERLREVCERYGIASLEVFGSVARGEQGRDSDVDLLYVLKPGARLGFSLFDLEDELATIFGRPVDLVARKAVNKYIREQVLADAEPLYAA